MTTTTRKWRGWKAAQSEMTEAAMMVSLHPGQRRVWDSQKRWIAMLSGTQSGKSAFGPHWMHREIDTKGPGDYIVMTPTYPLLNLKVLPEFLSVFEDGLHLGHWMDSDKVFKYHDEKTRVLFASAKNPESIESATALAAWLDEAGQKQFRRDAWEACLRRLALAQGRVLITTTVYCQGWLKTDVYDPWLAGDPNIDVIQFNSLMNPSFPREEYERAKRSMPPWKFAMFYEGKFDKPAGVVYDSFDDKAHVIPRFPIPPHWHVYSGHDFGGANPAAMFFARDPADKTGMFFAFHEYKPGRGYSTAEHVEQFKEITKDCTVIKRAGGSHGEEEIREAYRMHNWFIEEPKIKDPSTQRDRVYGLHKLGKLKVFSDLKGYLDEKLSYSYKLNDNYEPTDEIEDKNSYHLLDAERYIMSDFVPETVGATGFGKARAY